MDAEITALLQKVKEAKRTPFWQSTPEQAREGPMLMDLLFGPAPDVARVEDFCIASSDGHALPVRLYVPQEQPRGLIVYFHGGGWVIGSVAAYHPLTATLAVRTGCAVLSVDYRLAPEHPFPRPLEDAIAALRWCAEDADARLGSPVTCLIAMGDSAGGNLATVAARLHNGTDTARRVDFQILAYPVTGHDFNTESYLAYAEDHLLTRRDMMWFWDQYLPDPAKREDPLASPLGTRDLAGSPPALVLSAGCDPLRDEGEAYGRHLFESGIRAEVVRCEGLLHGFLSMIHYAPSASRAFDRILAAVKLVVASRQGG
jgi:acetyl esterase